MINKNYVVERFKRASNLLDTISDDADTAKRALAGLLTDKDRDVIYYDIDVLLDALGAIERSALLVGWITGDACGELVREDHNTTK